MQKFTQKYTIIALLEEKPEGYEYPSNNWPLHVTIADTFSIEWDIAKFKDELAELAKQLKPANAVGSHTEYFGPEKQIQVTILEMSKELVDIHYAVVKLLKEAGVKFNDPQYTEAGFKAHATVQPHAQINIGNKITLNSLAIIDMFPNEDPYQRKILKLLKF